MTHRRPTRGLTALWDNLAEMAQTIDDMAKCVQMQQRLRQRDWPEMAHMRHRVNLLESRVTDLDHECPAIAAVHDLQQRVTHLEEEQVSGLLARVRDLELVVATAAKPRIVGRELTPEQAAARDALREALRPAVERELAKLTDQRRQQAAQESVAATEVTPRIVQDGSRLAGMAVYNAKEATTRGDRDWALLALKRLREWAGILAGIGWQLPPCEILPLDPAEQHLRQAHDAVVRAQTGWETTLPGPLDTIAADIAVAIGHLKTWLSATAPPQVAQESQEPAPAPGLAPEDTGTATPRLTQRQRLVRADWALVWAQRHEGDRRRHDVVVALDWLREWADEAGIDTRQAIQATAWMIPATDTDAADRDWRLSEARRQIKQQLEDPSRNPYPVPVAIGLLTALEPEPKPEPQATPDMPALPPDPTPTQRAGQVIHHLGLAMMGQDPGPLHWVNLARWELQGWPHRDPTAVTRSWSADYPPGWLLADAVRATVCHINTPTSHATMAIACLDEWLRREAQA